MPSAIVRFINPTRFFLIYVVYIRFGILQPRKPLRNQGEPEMNRIRTSIFVTFSAQLMFTLSLAVLVAINTCSCSGSSDSKSDDTLVTDNDSTDSSATENSSDEDTDTADTTPPSFLKSATILLENNAVFPGIVYDGSRIIISYGKSNHLYVRPYDITLTPSATETQVTLDTDMEVGSGVTDHKHVFVNNAHYLLFSTIGDEDLYLMKLDTDLNRVGSIAVVTTGSTTTATNDMILGTDGTDIITGQFRPSNRNNSVNVILIQEKGDGTNCYGLTRCFISDRIGVTIMIMKIMYYHLYKFIIQVTILYL